MFKNVLKETQPMAYKLIESTFNKKRFSHAFLLVGKQGTPKLETAIFMCQILACTSGSDLACEKCNTCLRIANNNYADFKYYDFSEDNISKDDIDKLRYEFSKTALEESGKKFYIINNIEKLSEQAVNSILKFIEEPDGENTTGILIAESLERVLPTIVSRCQIINFKDLNYKDLMVIATNNGIKQPDAYIISNIKSDIRNFELFEENEYQLAIECAQMFLKSFDDLYTVLFNIHEDYLVNSLDDKDKFVVYLMEILSLFFKDVQKGLDLELGWYSDLIKEFKIKDYSSIILSLIETKDKCNKRFNVSLIVDQLIHKLIVEENK